VDRNPVEREKIDYAKGPLIGEGAYGKVYEGLDLMNGFRVAVKQVSVTKGD
jgi:serine/threonine protein kinase